MRVPLAYALGLASALVASAADAAQQKDAILPVLPDDRAMNTAIQKARGSLPDFVRRLQNPQPLDKAFLIKGRFEWMGQVEHIWVADLSLQGDRFHGVLANEPRIPTLKFKQSVTVPMDRVSDWMYLSNNRLIGGYTLRELRKRQTPAERAAEDKVRGYVIED